MNDDNRELVRRLFVAAAELIETAHDAAIAGQSDALADEDYAESATRLRAAAGDVVALADAAIVVAGKNPEYGSDPA